MSRRLSVFVLIDALGWRLLEGREFLSDLLSYRLPLRTVLGYSSGAIPTILTGVPPSRNGHWNLFYYDPQGSPFRWLRHFQFLPDRVFDHRMTRKLLKELGRRALGLGALFECSVSPRLLPWFNYVEKRNIYDRGGIAGASSIFDQLAERGIPYRVYSYHRWKDQEICERAKADLRTSDAAFFFLYLCEMDIFLHNYCANPEEISRKLDWYDAELRKVFMLARELDPESSLTVFSDHGMTPVRKHHDVVKEVESLGLRMPEDYLAVYDSTMARFWFFAQQAQEAVVARLQALPCGRVVPDEELQQLGVFFADRRYGQVIYLMHPGWLLSRSDFNGRGWNPVGMHGYHPDDPYSDGVFLSNRPPSGVRAVGDVYKCMEEAVMVEVR